MEKSNPHTGFHHPDCPIKHINVQDAQCECKDTKIRWARYYPDKWNVAIPRYDKKTVEMEDLD